MEGGSHASVSRLRKVACRGEVVRVGGAASQRVDGEDFNVGGVVVPGVVENREQALLAAGDPILRDQGGKQAIAERRPISAPSCPVPRRRRFERRAGSGVLSKGTHPAPEMDPGERGQPHIAGGRPGRSRVPGWRTPRRSRQPGIAPARDAGELVRLRLQEAEPPRYLCGTTEVSEGVVDAVLDAGLLAEHRVPAPFAVWSQLGGEQCSQTLEKYR